MSWKCAADIAAGVIGVNESWKGLMSFKSRFASRWVPGLGEAAAVYGGFSAYSQCS